MAKIGLNNFRYSKLTESEEGTATYDGAKKPAKAISCKVDIKNNDASLYADDALAETIGIDNEDFQTMADLRGHKVSEDKKELTRNANDVAPYVGFGRIVTKMVNGAYKYTVEFLCKVKFSEPSQDDSTKGESVSFSTTELAGTVATLADGTWSKSKTFDTKTEAVTYLEGLMAKNSV